jgi:hypothetical protein
LPHVPHHPKDFLHGQQSKHTVDYLGTPIDPIQNVAVVKEKDLHNIGDNREAGVAKESGKLGHEDHAAQEDQHQYELKDRHCPYKHQGSKSH